MIMRAKLINYKEMQSKIHGAVIPLPVLYNDDLSIDYHGICEYTDWVIGEGIKVICLTFVYSVLDSITTEELLALTKCIAKTVNGRAIFIACTAGGPFYSTVEIVKKMEKFGADVVIIHVTEFMWQNMITPGIDRMYIRYIKEIARQVNIPLMSCALPNPFQAKNVTMLGLECYEELIKCENYIGMKDDVYIPSHRKELIQKYGDRLCIMGGGALNLYMLYHNRPNQSEFVYNFNPRKGLELIDMLDKNNYQQAIEIAEEYDKKRKLIWTIGNIHWLATTAVEYWALGFAKTWKTRLPIEYASKKVAEEILLCMKGNKGLYSKDFINL
jgi:dihydrodipicolinate synthase/N-acetylneuraminate lyase